MAAIIAWLLPEPDSPTMATVSPGPTLRSIPRTACTSPSGVSKRTCSPRMSRIGASAIGLRASPVARIEGIAQPVAEEIEREQRRHEENRREDQQPRSRLD